MMTYATKKIRSTTSAMILHSLTFLFRSSWSISSSLRRSMYSRMEVISSRRGSGAVGNLAGEGPHEDSSVPNSDLASTPMSRRCTLAYTISESDLSNSLVTYDDQVFLGVAQLVGVSVTFSLIPRKLAIPSMMHCAQERQLLIVMQTMAEEKHWFSLSLSLSLSLTPYNRK